MGIDIKDRIALGDDKFYIIELDDGRVQLVPAPDEVVENGTAINKELLQPLFDYSMVFQKVLTEKDDCDKLTDHGVYVYSTSSVPANAPFANAAVIEFFGSDSKTSQQVQRAYRYGVAGYSAFRPYYNNRWLAWTKSPVLYEIDFDVSAGGEVTFVRGTPQQLFEDIDKGNSTVVMKKGELAAMVFYPTIKLVGKYLMSCVLAGGSSYSFSLSKDSASNVEFTTIDAVFETGIVGNWTYRKWNSGVAEAWGTVDIELSKVAYEWATGTGIYCASGYATSENTLKNTFTSYDCVSIDPIQWYHLGASGRVTAGGTLEGNVFGKGSTKEEDLGKEWNMYGLKKGDKISVNCIVKGRWE